MPPSSAAVIERWNKLAPCRIERACIEAWRGFCSAPVYGTRDFGRNSPEALVAEAADWDGADRGALVRWLARLPAVAAQAAGGRIQGADREGGLPKSGARPPPG